MLLPEEAEELLEPLFLSMSEAVAAAGGCGINRGLGGGGVRKRAGAARTQAHGVRGRRGSAAAAVLGLHGDIFPLLSFLGFSNWKEKRLEGAVE